MIKKILFQLHWFLGITAGLILSIMGVTGAIYSYESQILAQINKDSLIVEAQPQDQLTPAEIFSNYHAKFPNHKIKSITVSSNKSEAAVVNINKKGARRGHNIYINPYDASILPELKGKQFFAFVQDLHRRLTIGAVGKSITGACAIILIFFIFSGIYLRWPKNHSFKQWFALQFQRKGRNFLFNLHAIVGTWVLVFYLIFAFTGLYWSYDWYRAGLFKVMNVEQPDRSKRNQNNGRPSDVSEDYAEKALYVAWQGLRADFSKATFNLPQSDQQSIVEVRYQDLPAQHERAYNSMEVDVANLTVVNHERYREKALNEKIMSSMLPVHRGSFFGPIWQFLAMLAALSMPLFFITGWMLYLKRRKQNKLTKLARKNSGQKQLTNNNGSTWLIAFASQTGTAEQIAWQTADSLQKAGENCQVVALSKLQAEELKQYQRALFIISTYGTGEPPDLSIRFAKKQMKTLDLSQLSYAVLALGSTEYPDSFCAFGHDIEQWLSQNSAQPIADMIEVNNADSAQLTQWIQVLANSLNSDLQAVNFDREYDVWTLVSRNALNPNSITEAVYEIKLKPNADYSTEWVAGDIAMIQPCNSEQAIQQFLAQRGDHLDSNLLIDQYQQTLGQILRNRDLTQAPKQHTTIEQLIDQLPKITAREYSIASVPAQQSLDLLVRQNKHDDGSLGIGSGWLTAHAEVGEQIAVSIRSNPAFHCIEDDRPVILIGNGTGLAGLLSILQQRILLEKNRNWLIFGERQREHDFYYQQQLEACVQNGSIERLDVAFSRDQEQRVYVQHLIEQNAELIKSWVDQGAVIYVCGSLEGMATGVDQALVKVLGQDLVNQLRDRQLYRRDVY